MEMRIGRCFSLIRTLPYKSTSKITIESLWPPELLHLACSTTTTTAPSNQWLMVEVQDVHAPVSRLVDSVTHVARTENRNKHQRNQVIGGIGLMILLCAAMRHDSNARARI